MPLPVGPRAIARARLVALLALALGPSLAAAQGRFVLPRSSERAIHDMLAAVELPAGCRWLGARIQRGRVRSRYRCHDGAIELVLVHAATAPPGARRTAHFALLEEAEAPEALRLALLDAVHAHERGDLFRYVDPAPAGREPSRQISGLTWASLALALLAIALGAWAARRRGDAELETEPALPRAPLIAVAAAWLGGTGVMLLTFRFQMDDFVYLTAALDNPWGYDPELRLVGVRIPFFLGARAPGTALFVAANFAAFAAALAATAALSRRLGAGRREAWLAALIVGLHPGFSELVRYGSGFQQLLALALVLSSALALDGAMSRPDGRGRAGLFGVGFGLGLLAALTKYPTAALAPPAALLLSARSGLGWRAAGRRALLILPVGAAMLAPLLLARIDLAGDRGGLGAVLPNARRMGLGAGEVLVRCAIPAAAALLIRLARAAPSGRLGVIRGWVAALLRRAPGRPPFGLVTLAGALLFALPFLFNQQYFKDYYVSIGALFAGVFGARAVASAWPARAGAWRWGLALLLALTLLPLRAIEASVADTPSNRLDDFLADVAAALEGAPRARSIRLAVHCPDGRDARESERLLAELMRLTERGAGIRWAAHLSPAVAVSFEGRGEVRLGYCASETPRVWLDGPVAREPAPPRRRGRRAPTR